MLGQRSEGEWRYGRILEINVYQSGLMRGRSIERRERRARQGLRQKCLARQTLVQWKWPK
eukprot:4284942-Pleurochrysis_carterae.AAC.1